MTDATLPAKSGIDWKETGYWAALFAVLGPPIGAILPLIALLVVGTRTAGWLGALMVLIPALPVAYLFGLLPSVITGALGALAAERLPSRLTAVGATAVIGAATSTIWAALMSGFAALEAWSLAWLALAGMIAAAACAWIATAPKQAKTPASETEAGA
ncbi:MAG TPA: hypothetical protein VIO94_07860 [Phenylobacterium sp.]